MVPNSFCEIAWESGIKQENDIDIFNVLGGEKLNSWQYFCDG